MFWVSRTTIVPPDCGVPRLSHQLPVTVVVVGAAVVVAVAVGWVVVVVVVVVMDVVVDVGMDVVDVAQDAKTRDVTMRQVSTIQIIPLFI
jgi:uncharacterized membrane protein